MPPESSAFSQDRADRFRTKEVLDKVEAGAMDDQWLRDHASDPAVRQAAALGTLLSFGKWDNEQKARARTARILAVGEADYRSTFVQTTARSQMKSLLQNGDFLGAVAINDLASLPPEYFSSQEILVRLATGVGNYERVRGYTRQDSSFPSLLARLPIPLEFYQRPEIVRAILKAELQELFEGNPKTLPLLRRIGIHDQAIADPDARRNAWRGVHASAVTGDDKTAREYAEAFGFDLKEMATDDVAVAYEQLVRAGRLKRAIAFARDCERLPEAEARTDGVRKAAVTGATRLIEKENLEGADELMDYVGLPTEARQEAITDALYELIRKENARAVARVTERWRVPESVLRERGSRIVRERFAALRSDRSSLDDASDPDAWHAYFRVDQGQRDEMTASLFARAWNYGERVMAITGLSREELEEGACDGRASEVGWGDKSEGHGWVPIDQEIFAIRAIRKAEVGGAEFSDRLVRRSVEALLTFLFNQTSWDRAKEIQTVRTGFPFVDSDMMHRAAIDAFNDPMTNRDGKAKVINTWLIQNDAEPLAWNDVRDRARDYIVRNLENLVPYAIHAMSSHLDIPREEWDAMLKETRDVVRRTVLHAERDRVSLGQLMAIFDLYGFTWDSFEPRDIPFELLVESKDSEFRGRATVDPWQTSVDSLLKLQARSANEEHDAWTNEFFPLVDALIEEGLLDRESAEDGALLVDLVKTFGMFDLPVVARVFLGLKRGPFASLSAEDRAHLVELVAVKASRMDAPNLINEMRKLRFDFQRELLLDKVPRRIGTRIGSELFLTVRGSTQWEDEDGQADETERLMDAWKETVKTVGATVARLEDEAVLADAENDPRWAAGVRAAELRAEAGRERERIAVAPGYEETSFAVPRTHRSKDGALSAEQEIAGLLYAMDDLNLPLGQALGKLDLASRRMRALDMGSEAWDRGAFAERMEEIAANETGDPDLLLELSARHLFTVAPSQWAKRLANATFASPEAELRDRAEFLSQYFLEHYLNPAQIPEHTGHAPFSETLRRAIATAWQVDNETGNPGIIQTVARIDAIRAKQLRVSVETVDLTLVPAQGPLRIFAGDIGDACYTSQHHELATGGFPGVRAMIYVRNRGKTNERLAGSVLFVETRVALYGERILVIRANNPRQNLVAQVDAASLVRQTVDAAIAIARRRGITYVGVVRDGTSMASSNRAAVSEFYAAEYQDADLVELTDESETNFNGYDIWDKHGEHPTAIVWKNDDPEAT